MTWQITAKSGTRRGVSWSLGEQPVTLGRSLSCDISINDPTVSRRHCEISVEGTTLTFRDLGSRNVTLVNGRIEKQCILSVGDEISLGNDVFIITQSVIADASGSAPSQKRTDNTTQSLSTTISLDSEDPREAHFEYPASAKEMVRLYQLSRQLYRTRSAHDYATNCINCIRELFPPEIRAHVCLGTQAQALDIYPKGDVLSDRILKQVAKVLGGGRSVLKFDRKHAFQPAQQVCISPIRTADGVLGAFVLLSSLRESILEERDLSRLNAISSVAGLHRVAASDSDSTPNEIPIVPEDERVGFLGRSLGASALRAEIRSAAQTRLSTLIVGERGTGKVLAARMIHHQSAAPRGPMITANCEAIAGAPFARTLLGEERPTDSSGRIIDAGLLDQANGGTLILREVGALTLENQQLLCRTLGQRTFARIGSTGEVSFHGRVITTSRVELETLASEGKFRGDLVKALSRIRLQIPPLRHRRADIRALAQHFLRNERNRAPRSVEGLTEDALGYLEELPLWGNAAELQATISRAARQGKGNWIESEDLNDGGTDGHTITEVSLDPLEHAEQTLIAAVVRQCDGNAERAARILGISQLEVERIHNQFDKTPRD